VEPMMLLAHAATVDVARMTGQDINKPWRVARQSRAGSQLVRGCSYLKTLHIQSRNPLSATKILGASSWT
jgi:hypothetical protein